MSITTKQGDKGKTRLYSGEKVDKHCLEIECVGELDELISALGCAKAVLYEQYKDFDSRDLVKSVSEIQQWLFIVGSDIATHSHTLGPKPVRVTDEMLKELDERRGRLEELVGRITDFIVPGQNIQSAHIDMARSICRRLERRISANKDRMENGEMLIKWTNRLSDYLFLLARRAESDLEYRKK